MTHILMRLPSALVNASHLQIKHNKRKNISPLKPRGSQSQKRFVSPSRKIMLQWKLIYPHQRQWPLNLIMIKQRRHHNHIWLSMIYWLIFSLCGPLSIYYALQMSRKLRKVLVMALMCPDLYKSCLKSTKIWASCMLAITFDEDDFFLGFEFHNQPLYDIISSLIEFLISKVDPLCLTKKYSQQKLAHGSCILVG